jgi:hypothetical protein
MWVDAHGFEVVVPKVQHQNMTSVLRENKESIIIPYYAGGSLLIKDSIQAQ